MMTQDMKKSKNLYKILGPVSSRLVTELSRNHRTVFTSQDAAQILGINTSQVKKLLYYLVKKGWLRRIEKGKYFLIPLSISVDKPYTENQFLIASKLIFPYYIGFQSMFHYYGYTEQLTNTIFIVSPKRKKDFILQGVNYKFIKTQAKKMFGLAEIKINNTSVQVSDREKTIVDCLDRPEYCGGIVEVVKGVWDGQDELDFKKMIEYTTKMDNSAIIKRLGYLLEILEMDKKVSINALKKMIKKGFSPLDPLLPKKGIYNSQWNILVNISKEEILSFKKV